MVVIVRKLCNYPGCRTYVDHKTTHCEAHTKQVGRDYNRFVRDERTSNFYASVQWRNLRKRVLLEEPLCVRCLEEGTVELAVIVDHIIELRDDWSKRLDIDNLEGLCRACHNTKTAEEKRKREEFSD